MMKMYSKWRQFKYEPCRFSCAFNLEFHAFASCFLIMSCFWVTSCNFKSRLKAATAPKILSGSKTTHLFSVMICIDNYSICISVKIRFIDDYSIKELYSASTDVLFNDMRKKI